MTGVLLSSVIALVIDSRRRKWEDERRWHAVRREIYADYLSGSQAFEDRAHAVAELGLRKLQWDALVAKWRDAREIVPDVDQWLEDETARLRWSEKRLNDRRERLEEAESMIGLIGSSAVRAAVEKYEEARAELWWLAGAIESEPDEFPPDRVEETRRDVVEMWSRCREAREAFRHTVAQELGVERPRRWRVWKR